MGREQTAVIASGKKEPYGLVSKYEKTADLLREATWTVTFQHSSFC